MEKFLQSLTKKYAGWRIVNFHTNPGASAGPGTGQAFIVTIESPDDGTDKPRTTKNITVGNVQEGDISESEG